MISQNHRTSATRGQAAAAAHTARTAPPVSCVRPAGDPVKDPALPRRPRPGLVSKLQHASASGGSKHTHRVLPSRPAAQENRAAGRGAERAEGECVRGTQPDRIGVRRHRATIGDPSDACDHTEYDPGKAVANPFHRCDRFVDTATNIAPSHAVTVSVDIHRVAVRCPLSFEPQPNVGRLRRRPDSGQACQRRDVTRCRHRTGIVQSPQNRRHRDGGRQGQAARARGPTPAGRNRARRSPTANMGPAHPGAPRPGRADLER